MEGERGSVRVGEGGSVGIGAGKCIEMWESVWDECGKVCWGVGGGEERCGECKEVWGEVCESWGRGVEVGRVVVG